MFWPFAPLEVAQYDLLMVDPPWPFKTYSEKGEEKSPQAQYDCMTIDQIKRLPIRGLGRKDCLLWLWATNPMLDVQIDVLKAWGFDYATAGTWAKMTKHGKQAFGTGFIFRCSSEMVLIGTRGNPKTTRSVRSLFFGPVRQHSRKPDEAYEQAEKLMPNARRADIFSRQRRPGWDSWGKEADKFQAA